MNTAAGQGTALGATVRPIGIGSGGRAEVPGRASSVPIGSDASLLVYGTDFDHPTAWRAHVFPGSREATGHRYAVGRNVAPRIIGSRTVSDADRERNRFASARRGHAQMRRYAVYNVNTGLGVLTFADAVDHDQAWAAWSSYSRRVRRRFGRFPYIVAMERHYSHGVHLNWLLPPGDHREKLSMWDHGFVSYPRTGLHAWLTTAEKARALVSYVTKDWNLAADQTPPRSHRYRTARGFTPPSFEITAPTLGDLYALLTDYFGAPPSRFWSSRDVPDWPGPAATAWRWR